MKNTIIALVIAFASFTPTAYAMEPGYGGDIDCNPWREGDSKGASGQCFSNADDTNKRLYELEIAVDRLQHSQTGASSRSSDNESSTGVSQHDFDRLEARVSFLESTFDKIQSALATITSFLGSLAARI